MLRTLLRTTTKPTRLARSLATHAPAPVVTRKTTHGGLRDQDRIFSNAYMKHDHGLKGAMVSNSFNLEYIDLKDQFTISAFEEAVGL